MPRLTGFNAMVLSSDIGGGKAVIEMKAARSTWTIEVAEDSGWANALVEGAILHFPDIEVELPREAPVLTTGPQPGDEISTHEGIVTIPQPETKAAAKPTNVAPDPEAIRLLHPIPGFNTVGINASTNGESIKDLLGLPSYAPDDGTTKIATATRSSNQT